MNLHRTTRIALAFCLLSAFNLHENPKHDNWKSEMLYEVNALRAKGCRCPGGKYYQATQALTWNETLALAAEGHAKDMDQRNYFDHESRDGRSFTDRITAAGYHWRAASENIAYNYSDAKSVVLAWRKSKGHCKNLMNPLYKEMGAGLAGDYWVQDLASRAGY